MIVNLMYPGHESREQPDQGFPKLGILLRNDVFYSLVGEHSRYHEVSVDIPAHGQMAPGYVPQCNLRGYRQSAHGIYSKGQAMHRGSPKTVRLPGTFSLLFEGRTTSPQIPSQSPRLDHAWGRTCFLPTTDSISDNF